MSTQTGRLDRLVAAAAVAAFTACGGGGGAGGGSPATVEESLTALGVDITPTARVADEATQRPLPGDYAPFGASRTLDKFDELLVLGVPLSPAAFAFESLVNVVNEQQSPSTPGVFTTEALYAPAVASTPWASSSGAAPATVRAAASGDVDGDGVEELLVASRASGDPSIQLRVVQDRSAAFSNGNPIDVSSAAPVALAVEAGDFDGDGKADAVVAVSTATDVQLVFLSSASGSLALTGKTITLTPATASPAIDVSLAAGNLDDDAPDELVVVLNERFQAGGADSGTSRYWVYDDAGTDFAARRLAQPVSASAGGASRSALTASVTVGDVDGDNVGEVVLGGLASFDTGGTCAYAYLLVALDGLDASLAPLGADYENGLFPAGSNCSALRMRTVHVVTLDRDGDGADEIQANELAFEDFRQAAPWTPLGSNVAGSTDVPLHELFGGAGSTYAGEFSRATSAFAAGDVTSDKKDDLLFYSQFAAPTVVGYATSIDPSDGQERWRRAVAVPMAASPPDPVWPVLRTANVDADSMSIQYASAERRVVFTEPIVIAALAAPPCARDLGQNLDACRTSFGTAKSSTVALELTYTVTAGITVGAKTEAGVPGLVFEAEVAATIKSHWSAKLNRSYTLTKRVVRTTGPLEDGVIFTSIPYDQFVYRITSHPDPTLVGTEVVVSLPRTPVETLVERSFFNSHVPAGSLHVDDSVFTHVPGVPHSYPTAARKDALVASFPDLFNGPFDVGQGGGTTSVEIDVARTLGGGVAYGVEQTLDVKATAANVMVGFTIGRSAEASLSITHGSESYYAGSVSNISADRYNPGTAYKFGLFTYVHDDPRQSFEVVDYWVQ